MTVPVCVERVMKDESDNQTKDCCYDGLHKNAVKKPESHYL